MLTKEQAQTQKRFREFLDVEKPMLEKRIQWLELAEGKRKFVEEQEKKYRESVKYTLNIGQVIDTLMDMNQQLLNILSLLYYMFL